ncbi:MAG: hypothetical protein NTW12_14935 [Deltaproteobacteria bacterium]|nr:hypothetical protein [Deltaproteobacteria bacterium]
MTKMKVDWTKRTVKMWGTMEHIYDYFEEKDYFFSREILTRYFLSLKTKPFVILTGISGTGKTKIAQVFAEYMCQDEKTQEERESRIAFVPVRPDWMDNKGLLGYYNLLDEKYYATPVLRLLLEAEEHPEKPYFVILDEMNLAKVEQYFSDFLSIMESRTPGNPKGEAIPLHALNKPAQTLDGLNIPPKIHVPPNVYFTGTVNVDESTYMFSPKVLDRANVIEFNEVNLDNYAKGIIPSDHFALKDPDVRQRLLPADGDSPFCTKKDFIEAMKVDADVGDYLNELLDILRPFNLHFGYRVINEISRYICYALDAVDKFDLNTVMDIQILQKILPKFHGAQARMGEPLSRLFASCCNDEDEGALADDYLRKAAEYNETPPCPRSARKLARMILNLKSQGYTSFIE